ncbi:MAG: hypothetical protein U5L01_12355 [Rheinheimera sp.]|nr:hypothetical protein [Rheinheimera sp.]
MIAEIELRASTLANATDPQRMLGFLQSLQQHASSKQCRVIEKLRKQLNELAGRFICLSNLHYEKEHITELDSIAQAVLAAGNYCPI